MALFWGWTYIYLSTTSALESKFFLHYMLYWFCRPAFCAYKLHLWVPFNVLCAPMLTIWRQILFVLWVKALRRAVSLSLLKISWCGCRGRAIPACHCSWGGKTVCLHTPIISFFSLKASLPFFFFTRSLHLQKPLSCYPLMHFLCVWPRDAGRVVICLKDRQIAPTLSCSLKEASLYQNTFVELKYVGKGVFWPFWSRILWKGYER